MKDLMSVINPRPVIAPQVGTDNTAMVGAIIDRNGYESVTYIINTGTLADADATFAVLLEEGDDSALADAATVVAPNLIGTAALAGFTFANDGVCRKIGYLGSKQYTRLTITPSANTGNAPIGAICILGHPHQAPTDNPPT